MNELRAVQKMLDELRELTDNCEAETGETMTAHEAIDAVEDFIQSRLRQAKGTCKPKRQGRQLRQASPVAQDQQTLHAPCPR